MTSRSRAGPSGEGYRVILVDDDQEMRDSLGHLLDTAGWQVENCTKAESVEARLESFSPDVVLSDVRMPGLSGLDLLRNLQGLSAPPMVLISAHGDIPMAVQAMQEGAYSFLEKPFDPNRLLTVLRRAAERHRLSLDRQRLKARLAQLSNLDRVLLGDTPQIAALREEVIDLGSSDAAVMLLGETGTGKELVARALHDLGNRAGQAFVAVNCAAIPVPHFEATMFGDESNRGLLSQADGGTLFLDEIGACPIELQAKLLRVLETQEFRSLGQEVPQRVNLRIISASNEALDEAVAEGRFREDLLFRLNTVVMTLPALRERRDDIHLLYTHFLELYGALYEIHPPEATAEDVAALLSHSWPGNVRELRHVAERRALAARRGRGSVAEAIHRDAASTEVPETLREAVAAFERQLIAQAIRAHAGRMDAVAEALGIGRRTLNEKIVKLGLNKDALL